MNILQLELLAFGAFTNKILDFSAKQPGFHLIYGPNEAGKRKNTLLDIENKPLNEKYLLDYLGSEMDEAKFVALFCFDYDCLRQGGESLLQADGDVGESLFEAGSGSVRVHEVLTQLDKEKDELFKASGSKSLLNQTINTYKEKQNNLILRLEEIEQQLTQQNKALELLPDPPDLTLLQASLARACKHSELIQELTDALLPLKEFIKGELLTQLSSIIEQANTCVNLISKLQRKFEKLQLEINNLNKDKTNTELAKIQADAALEKWQQQWKKALKPLKLPADTATETVRDVLDTLDQISNKIDKANSLKRRVKLMEKDAKIFKADVKAIAEKLAVELINEPVEQIVAELSNRLSQTEQDLARLEHLQQSIVKEQQHYTNAKQEIEASQARLQALLEQAHCENLADLEQAEQDSLHKKALQAELITVEQQLLKQGEGLSLSDLEQAAAEIDIEQLAVQIETTIEQIQQIEQERSQIDQTIGELRTLLKQMDGNAAAAQAADEAQLALAEMQTLSERYIQIHLAASVLRKSIERYREQNQGPVINRASEIFQQLTLNQFAGIKTDYSSNTDQPILMGIRQKDNKGLTTNLMSDGTRDQLYLALRLASIERYPQPRLPLILDDILIYEVTERSGVNFDDERSQATLSILGELSKETQILFLTHHPHLIELSERAVPGDCLVKHML
jgi:uncharacterized protein YhaN